jgi:Tfp pilus assembly protein PilF
MRLRWTSILALSGLALFGRGCQSDAFGPPRQNTEAAKAQNEAAYKLIVEGKFNEAEDILRNAKRADVMYGPVRSNLGLVYLKQHKLYEAAWEFENAIKLMPHQPEVRNNLGMVFEEAGKLKEATESFNRALELEPDNPVYIGNLAKVRIKRKLLDEETRKLLKDVVFKDTRRDWIDWAKLQLIRVPPPGEDIISFPTTRPVQ